MFVDRDADGNVTAVFRSRQRDGQEELPDDQAAALLGAYRVIKRSRKDFGVRLDDVVIPAGAIRACIIRLSGRWVDLPLARKNKVTGLLNDAADRIIGELA